MLLEPTNITADVTKPAVFVRGCWMITVSRRAQAPLMGERGKVELVSKRTDANGVTTLRAKVRVAGGSVAVGIATKSHVGGDIEGWDGYEPSISWGGANDDVSWRSSRRIAARTSRTSPTSGPRSATVVSSD